MVRRMRAFALLLCILALAAPARAADSRPADAVFFQAGVIDALLAGGYAGFLPLDELARKGSVGLGTFDALDGELVLLDGQIYQVPADGRVRRPAGSLTTPFAQAAGLSSPARAGLAPGMDLKAVEATLDAALGDLNAFAAARIDASFALVTTRSVPRQAPPYRPLAEVAREQTVFELGQVRGTLVGLRGPAFAKGMGVPGWHWHFLSEDRARGGHVLAFRLEAPAEARYQVQRRFELVLPGQGLQGLDLSRDRSRELHEVEAGR